MRNVACWKRSSRRRIPIPDAVNLVTVKCYSMCKTTVFISPGHICLDAAQGIHNSMEKEEQVKGDLI